MRHTPMTACDAEVAVIRLGQRMMLWVGRLPVSSLVKHRKQVRCVC